jgi:uncharacterized integral membrane protein
MRSLLKLIAWPLRIVLFLLLAILASLNLHESTVFLFLGHQWRAPMAVLLLIAFAAGAVLGVIAITLRHLRLPLNLALKSDNPESVKAISTPPTATQLNGPPSVASHLHS